MRSALLRGLFGIPPNASARLGRTLSTGAPPPPPAATAGASRLLLLLPTAFTAGLSVWQLARWQEKADVLERRRCAEGPGQLRESRGLPASPALPPDHPPLLLSQPRTPSLAA